MSWDASSLFRSKMSNHAHVHCIYVPQWQSVTWNTARSAKQTLRVKRQFELNRSEHCQLQRLGSWSERAEKVFFHILQLLSCSQTNKHSFFLGSWKLYHFFWLSIHLICTPRYKLLKYVRHIKIFTERQQVAKYARHSCNCAGVERAHRGETGEQVIKVG